MPRMKYVERKTHMRSSAQYRHSLKLLTFQPTTTLQLCKLIYAFEGGLRGFGGTAACTFTISSRTMSVQLKEIPLPSKRTPFIILLSLRKSKRRGNSPSAPDISNLQHHIAVYVQQEFYAETSMCCQQVKVSSTADERNLCCR